MPLLLKWRKEIDTFSWMCSRNYDFDVIIIVIACIVIILIINNVFFAVMLQNCQVIVTSFGCCWYSGSTPQSLDCWSSCNIQGTMGVGGMGGDSGIIMEDVCEDGMQNLGARLVSMLLRAGILVGGLVVVVVGVMVVVAVGVVSFSEEWCLIVREVEC